MTNHRTGPGLPGFLRAGAADPALLPTAGRVDAQRTGPPSGATTRLIPGTIAPEDLARYPWVGFDCTASHRLDETRPCRNAIPARLLGAAPSPAATVLRFGAPGLFALSGRLRRASARWIDSNACPAAPCGRSR